MQYIVQQRKEVFSLEKVWGFVCTARVDQSNFVQMFGQVIPGEDSDFGCQSLGWKDQILPFTSREDADRAVLNLEGRSCLSEVRVAYIEMEITDEGSEEDLGNLEDKGPWVVLQGSEGHGGISFFGPEHPTGDIQIYGEFGATGFLPFRDFQNMKWCLIETGRRGGLRMRASSWRMKWLD